MGKTNLEGYQQAVTEIIIPEIKIARILQKIFIRFPEVTIKLLKFDERVWKACCYYARGDIDYVTAKQKIGGFKEVKTLLKQVLT